MLNELLDASELFAANVAHPDTSEVSQGIANVAEDSALVTSMQQNIFQREISQLTRVTIVARRRGVVGNMAQHQLLTSENVVAEVALVDLREID